MTDLKIPAEDAISLIAGRLEDLKTVQENSRGSAYYTFVGWCSGTWRVIDRIYGPDNIRAEEIRSLGMPSCSCSSPADTIAAAGQYVDLLKKYLDEIQAGIARKE